MGFGIGTRITHGPETYEIKELLKSGGFGDAFLAERTTPTSTTKVVIKVPAAHVLADPIWLKKFSREARILANIKHPNVVKIIAYLEFPNTGEKALVQELVHGAAELPAYVKANPESAASLLLQTLYAMHAFHSTTSPSAVHRDLSPSNILVSDAGEVKVIDFGLAKEDPRATKALTVAGHWFGTPGCMSPEQCTDAAGVDHRTDLFAVGRSFTAVLQGRDPQHARPEQLQEPWKTICLRLTEHDATDRPPNAAEAMSEVMSLFSAAGVTIQNFQLHVAEMSVRQVPAGWPDLCQTYFLTLPDYHHSDIRLMWGLNGDVFKTPFDSNALFDRVETSTAVQEFSSGTADFDDVDPLGELYARMYPHLAPPRKLKCFERICRAAVEFHRYSVMQDARNAFSFEKDSAIRDQLVAILDAEDPGKVIQGRGVLPRNP